MKFILVAFTTFLLCLSLAKAQTGTIPLKGNFFNVTYSFVNITSGNSSSPGINLILVGNTTGWMGIGFNNDKSMVGGDFMVAGYDASQPKKGYVMDYHLPKNGSNRAPIKDKQNDWTLTGDVTLVINNSTKFNGTRLVVQRLLNTNDTEDMAIEKEKQFILLWAYKASPWNASGNNNRHDERGTLTVNLSLDNPIVDDNSGASSTLCSVSMGTLLASLLLLLRN